MLCVTIMLDGKTHGVGYKYIITKGGMSWTGYRSDKAFRRFMKLYGLKINTQCTQVHDFRQRKDGYRCITTCFHDKEIRECYFWSLEEIPAKAIKYIDLCNGNFVDCYILNEGEKVSVFRPNSNAKDVYKPYDYWSMSEKYS